MRQKPGTIRKIIFVTKDEEALLTQRSNREEDIFLDVPPFVFIIVYIFQFGYSVNTIVKYRMASLSFSILGSHYIFVLKVKHIYLIGFM